MLKATINMGLLALCLALSIVLATWTVSPPGQIHHGAESQKASEQGAAQKGETFWQKTTSDPVAFFTLWLVAFTAVLAASTIGLWIVTWKASVRQSRDMEASIAAAKRSTEVAKATMIASQRAWLRRDRIYFSSPLIFRDDGLLHSAVSFEFSNVGNAPAFHIHKFAWLLPVTDGIIPGTRAKELFEIARMRPLGGGFTIFPGQAYPRYNEPIVGQAMQLLKDEVDAASDEAGRMSLYVAACINYTFASDPATNHQTSCLFEVQGFISRDRSRIPVNDLKLEESGFLGVDLAD